MLHNCTLTGNSAARDGGGAYEGTLNNCIVYSNTALVAINFRGGTLNYCCTTPLPASGTGNITAEPLLADPAHLSAASPCRGAGSADYASGVDIDGEAWASPPAIGCDEFYPGPVTGPLTVAVSADCTNAAVGEALCFTGQILGHATASLWDFGDGTVVSNCPYASHAWIADGDYPVALRAYNDSYPGGMSATVSVHVVIVTLGTGTGLNGDYYSNRMDFAGLPTLSRLDPTINFDWGEGSPDPLISADRFSVRWSGYVQPFYSQTYTFYTTTDDGVRLWVNGQRIIDAWWDQILTERSGAIALTENQKYPIIVEYYENGVGASAVLSWSGPSQPKRVVPQTQLYPAASSQPLLGYAGLNGGTNLVLTWGGTYTLQTATNVVGPYTDLSGSTSPYTNNLAGPRRFFRLISR
jgi:PKD repeat protein